MLFLCFLTAFAFAVSLFAAAPVDGYDDSSYGQNYQHDIGDDNKRGNGTGNTFEYKIHKISLLCKISLSKVNPHRGDLSREILRIILIF